MLRVKIESNVQEPHIKVSSAGLAVKVEGRKRGKNDHQAEAGRVWCAVSNGE